MSTEPEAYYDSKSNHKHSWGLPEIVIPNPKVKLPVEKLYERAEILLNENQGEMEELLQMLCHEGSAKLDVVTTIAGGKFHVSASAEVYHGCRDHLFSHHFEVVLDSTLDAEGMHVFVPEDTRISFDEDEWLE